jgi:hypothetical protein
VDSAPGEQLRIACTCWFAVLLLLCLSALSSAQDEALRLRAQRVEAQGFQRFIAEGDAEVQWGNRSVRAQRMEGDLQTGWITATGDVQFSEERGVFRASRLRFNLKTLQGELSDVRGEIEGIFITANALQSDGNTLNMQEVTLTTCDQQTPHFLLSARQLSLGRDLRLRARTVSLIAWGRKWATLPYLSRRIGRREPGEPLLPQIGFSRRRGVMLSYGELLSQRWGQVRYGARLFTRHDPEIRIDLLRRLDKGGDQEPLPHLEPTERPGVSFLETVSTSGWRTLVRTESKQGVYFSLRANSPVENLQRTDLYLGGVELGYQTIAPLGGGSLESEWRVGRLRESPTLVTATSSRSTDAMAISDLADRQAVWHRCDSGCEGRCLYRCRGLQLGTGAVGYLLERRRASAGGSGAGTGGDQRQQPVCVRPTGDAPRSPVSLAVDR